VKNRIPKRFGFDPIRDVQVLCPMNRGGVGARSLNIELQAALNPTTEQKVERFGWTFAPGDTQSFNTTTSMGRLTLNILLSFAQFEREVIGERIRDKFAVSRKRGMWMGGFVPMGYDVKDRKLVVNEAEAATVRMIFERFAALGSASTLARALQAEDVRNKRGKRIDKGFIYKLISSRVYLGEAVHKGISYPGEHDAIIAQELWDRVHAILKESPRERRAKNRNNSEALLKGIIFTDTGAAMTPTYTRKGERLYHYYTSMDLIRNRDSRGGEGPMRLAAAMVDGAVIAEMRRIIGAPEIAARVIEAQRRDGGLADERFIVAALQRFNDLWDALYPAEQARIVRLLVDRVTVGRSGMAVDLRNNGIAMLVRELGDSAHLEAAE
jgi:site-specific DNA recombinase